MIQKIVLLINLYYLEVSFHLIRVFYVYVRACLGADMVYVSRLSVASVQKRHVYSYMQHSCLQTVIASQTHCRQPRSWVVSKSETQAGMYSLPDISFSVIPSSEAHKYETFFSFLK